jgi:hypothetical protein
VIEKGSQGLLQRGKAIKLKSSRAINDSCDVGKGKASTARARIQLTPPPELSEERKAELRAAMECVLHHLCIISYRPAR